MRKDNKISEIQILNIIYDNLANDFYGFEKNLIKSKLNSMYHILVLTSFWLLSVCLEGQDIRPVKHVFYLHGMIIEVQGVNAVSDDFGPYKYNSIIDSLDAAGYQVHSEVRTAKNDFNAFCQKVSREIRWPEKTIPIGSTALPKLRNLSSSKLIQGWDMAFYTDLSKNGWGQPKCGLKEDCSCHVT